MPIVAAGVLAQQAVVRAWIALPVCIVGVVAGDIALYWIGRHWGERILDWGWVRRVLSPAREEALMRMYRRHAVKTIFTARHIVGFRAAAFLTAGIAHVSFPKFLAIDLLAAFVSVPVGFGVAFFFTDQLAAVLEDVHRVERWALLLLIAAAVVWAAVLAWRRNRRLARERAALARSAVSD